MSLAKKSPSVLGLRCPNCGGRHHQVKDSRDTQFGIRRRRECPCGARFTTLEHPVRWDSEKSYN
jgi:transcriptional regulator NrdR family protein